MYNILKKISLITHLNVSSDTNTTNFYIDKVKGMARNFPPSFCIALLLESKKNISNSTLKNISLLLACLEETKDNALQCLDNNWWLCQRFNLDDNINEISISLEKLLALNRYFFLLLSKKK